MTCANCFHEFINHKEGSFCTETLSCMCQHYETPMSEFINEINKSLELHKTIEKKVKFILEKIPNLRNAGEKSFSQAYRRIVFGLNKNDPIPRGLWKHMPHDDSINRARRKVVQHNPDLGKTDHKAITMAGATQQGILEWLTT